MSNEKILKVMAEVNGEVCERGELIHGIALALLTRKICLFLVMWGRQSPTP